MSVTNKCSINSILFLKNLLTNQSPPPQWGWETWCSLSVSHHAVWACSSCFHMYIHEPTCMCTELSCTQWYPRRWFCSSRYVWEDTVEWGQVGLWTQGIKELLCFQFQCKCVNPSEYVEHQLIHQWKWWDTSDALRLKFVSSLYPRSNKVSNKYNL